jgi:Tol biopolymer transport system component
MYSRASVGRAPRQLVVRTRDGKMESLIPTTATFLEPRLSPDGRTVLVTEDNRRRELWMVDVARRQISPLLKGEGDIFSAAWYADSKRFAYAREAYAYELYRSAIDGSVSDSMLLGSSKDKYPNSVAADGSSLWFTGGDERARMLDLRTGTRRLVLKDSTPSPRPSISPNGKWVAYESFGGTGARNVVITSSDGTGTTHRVSVDGGAEAIWTRGGRELVYRNGTAMMAAEVNPETGDVAAPALLFRASAAPTTENKTRSYDVSADGSRFVMVEPVPGGAPLNVIVVNWVEELKRKMAASH